MKFTDADVGRNVVYTPWPECPPEKQESGRITEIRGEYVFVMYAGDLHSKATHPDYLQFETGAKR